MFTGIIEETGKIETIQRSKKGALISISADMVMKQMKIGDSIACNGTCLTVVKFDKKEFYVELSPETLQRTTFSKISKGAKVNLERPIKLNDRLGGHLVSGHIDGVGQVIGIKDEGNSVIMEFSIPPEFVRYIIPKGSIAIEGISLTVVEIHGNQFPVALIPHTMEITNLGDKKIGDGVNLEFDLVAKYIERFSQFPSQKNDITYEYLQTHGFA